MLCMQSDVGDELLHLLRLFTAETEFLQLPLLCRVMLIQRVLSICIVTCLIE